MTYSAPVDDIMHALDDIAGFSDLAGEGLFEDVDSDLARSILEEAGRFAAERIAPLNRPGDVAGARLADGGVAMPAGWREAYRAWAQAGWAALPAPKEHGGQGLPVMLSMAVSEVWQSASMAFALNPLLTQGAAETLHAFGSEELKARYLGPLVSGQWSGTMQLTEPHAGSDLRFLKTRAQPQQDGAFRLFGTKIFITYGEHDLTENIVHLVLARTSGAPDGTKGLSLFLVPKFLPAEDGPPGARNDIRCLSIEHKLGIHASPTCVMQMGEEGGAVGWLVGEERQGLNHMFLMMNRARLGIGVQGVAIAERAFQQALAFARERRQGATETTPAGEMAPIIAHPDVRRMLLSMKARTAGARALCLVTARELDRAERAHDAAARRAALAWASLLTPAAKALATDLGVETASDGIQVHGGMGYVEETGAAQHLRDARIAPIYEGTNGIQAIDLVTRKLALDGGEALGRHMDDLRAALAEVRASNAPGLGEAASRLETAVTALREASDWLLATLPRNRPAALAGATPYTRLFGLTSAGVWLARGALAAQRKGREGARGAAVVARHFAETEAVAAPGLALAVTQGSGAILDAEAALGG